MAIFSKYLMLSIKPMLGLWLLLGFIFFTIIGTLTHELGHVAFAKMQGFETSLHYGYMNFDKDSIPKDIEEISKKYKDEISQGLDFPEKARWEEVRKRRSLQSFWVYLGGPFQTILFGTIGFILLYRKRHIIQENGMYLLDWLYVFLGFFWLREWFNVMTAIVRSIVGGDYSPFSGSSDEIHLARHLNWWEGSISLPLAIIAFVIACYIIFVILPKPERLTFIISGLLGGVLGFWFWLIWLGPMLMP